MELSFKQRIDSLLRTDTTLSNTFNLLNESGIRWGIFAGTHVMVATGYRSSTDVDILIHDEDIEKCSEIFQDAKILETPDCKVLLLTSELGVELMSKANFMISGHKYRFRLSDLAWEHSQEIRINDDVTIRFLNDFDTILLKAMHQRGKEEGKRDSEDIHEMLKYTNIDLGYFRSRLEEVNPDSNLISFLESLGIYIA